MSGPGPGDARPAVVPEELVPAWDLVERGEVGGIVVDADAALWWARPAADRHAELGRRLAAEGALHPSLSPEAFAAVRLRAEDRAGSGARLTEVWALVPEWVHPGRARDAVLDLELELGRLATVPDPDVALLLTAAAARRLPIRAIATTPLSGDQVRRRLECPALDAVAWRDVTTTVDTGGDDPAARAVSRGGATSLLLAVRTPTDVAGAHVVLVGGGGTPGGPVAADRTAERLAASSEAAAVPEALRAAWTAGATVTGPVLAGFAEWAVRHAAGHPNGVLVLLGEPEALLGDVLEAVAGAVDVPPAVRRAAVTPELLVAATADARPIEAVLTADVGVPAVAALLGLDGGDDPRRVAERLAADPGPRGRVSARASALRDEVLALVAGEPPEAPLTLCGVGGSGVVQDRLRDLLADAGRPRHVAGFHLATDARAAAAVVGAGGGEVHGFLANLGDPAHRAATADAWRTRLERLAGAPDRSRTDLGAAGDAPEDLTGLELEAERRGAHAALRAHVRLLRVAGYPATLHDAAPLLADRLAAADAPAPSATPHAEDLEAPAWLAPVLDDLEREVASARAETARVAAVTAGRSYRAAVRARGLARRLRP